MCCVLTGCLAPDIVDWSVATRDAHAWCVRKETTGQVGCASVVVRVSFLSSCDGGAARCRVSCRVVSCRDGGDVVRVGSGWVGPVGAGDVGASDCARADWLRQRQLVE